MSFAVALNELAGVAMQHGPAAFVLTTDINQRPRVIHVVVEVADNGNISARVGTSAATNVMTRPNVCVLWPQAADGFSLIADGVAEIEGNPRRNTPIKIKTISAVRHRPARKR